ncbi:MAG: hypothetical protein QW407_04220, partial [Thermofilaceae archaeon]
MEASAARFGPALRSRLESRCGALILECLQSPLRSLLVDSGLVLRKSSEFVGAFVEGEDVLQRCFGKNCV